MGQAEVGHEENCAPITEPDSSSSESEESPKTKTQPGNRVFTKPVEKKPRWRAEFLVDHDSVEQVVLGDTGCNKTCMSEQLYRQHPYLKNSFKLYVSYGRAINGSQVLTMGVVNLKFKINGRKMRMPCNVIKGLVQPLILGWDFFSKYDATLNTAKGTFEHAVGSVPLLENSPCISGCFYRVQEELIVPPNSKLHTEVELMLDKEHSRMATNTVVTEPLANYGSDVWSCRACSTVRNGMFMTEFINCCEYPVKLEAGQVIGYAEFVDPEAVDSSSVETEMMCSFKGEDSAYESGESDDDEPAEEIEVDESPESCKEPAATRPPPKDVPEPKPKVRPKTKSEDAIPEGAKKLTISYDGMAKDAKPYTEQLKELLEVKHDGAFSKHDRDYGKTNLIKYHSHMKDPDGPPLAQPPYRTRPEMREVDKQAFEMIADGLVGHSTSPYSAPILLAKKKCGGWRFLTDFRKVNERCNKVVYPLPRIEDSIQRLDNPQFFSSMDLTKGFWQIPIHPKDRKFFAFSTESMHLEYLVAPMGAKNSPSYLSALMQLVLRGLPAQHVISYLDDILVADNSMEDHLKHLDKVLTALEKAGLKLNPSKCSFARDSVICLGHKLSREGIAPDPANIAKIKSWKPPQSVKQLRAFLGLTGYYRQFVKQYSQIAGGLTDLTKDDVKWEWAEEHQKAFETLRNILVSDLIMNYPDFSKPFIIKSDASLAAIGYVLTQKVNGKEKVISYGSKKLTRTQQRWATYDREYFGLISAIRANAHYLRRAPFVAVTDHRPLLAWKKTDTKKDPTGRRTRWAIELDNYDFELIYKKGRIHSDADAMSRRGDDDDEYAEDDEEFAFFQEGRECPLILLGMDGFDESSLVRLNADDKDVDRLKRKQNEDPILDEVKRFVRRRRRPPRSFPDAWFKRNFTRLAIRDGVLYRKAYADTIVSHVMQAVIPDSLVQEVIQDLHGSVEAGHPNTDVMLAQVRRYAVWPSMNKDIEDAVKNCQICDRMREPVPKNKTPLVPIIADRVFKHVMCDLIQLPVTSLGYKYTLVFRDVFSGYVKLYKLKSKVTTGVARAFEELTCTLGPPTLLTSDRGGEFTSHLMEAVCQLKGAAKRTSVAYRPQSQGNVERYNRILIKDLTKCIEQYGKTWVDHIPYVEWSHNTRPCSKTGMSPYLIFFGREPISPPFADIDDAQITDKDTKRYFEKMKIRQKKIHDEANARAEEKRAKDKKTYDRKAKHAPFEEGDKVYERIPDERRHKLQPKWDGPIEIQRRRSSPTGSPGTTYECRKQDGSICERNYEQLKAVRTEREQPIPPPPPPVEAAGLTVAMLALLCSLPGEQPDDNDAAPLEMDAPGPVAQEMAGEIVEEQHRGELYLATHGDALQEPEATIEVPAAMEEAMARQQPAEEQNDIYPADDVFFDAEDTPSMEDLQEAAQALEEEEDQQRDEKPDDMVTIGAQPIIANPIAAPAVAPFPCCQQGRLITLQPRQDSDIKTEPDGDIDVVDEESSHGSVVLPSYADSSPEVGPTPLRVHSMDRPRRRSESVDEPTERPGVRRDSVEDVMDPDLPPLPPGRVLRPNFMAKNPFLPASLQENPEQQPFKGKAPKKSFSRRGRAQPSRWKKKSAGMKGAYVGGIRECFVKLKQLNVQELPETTTETREFLKAFSATDLTTVGIQVPEDSQPGTRKKTTGFGLNEGASTSKQQ